MSVRVQGLHWFKTYFIWKPWLWKDWHLQPSPKCGGNPPQMAGRLVLMRVLAPKYPKSRPKRPT